MLMFESKTDEESKSLSIDKEVSMKETGTDNTFFISFSIDEVKIYPSVLNCNEIDRIVPVIPNTIEKAEPSIKNESVEHKTFFST